MGNHHISRRNFITQIIALLGLSLASVRCRLGLEEAEQPLTPSPITTPTSSPIATSAPEPTPTPKTTATPTPEPTDTPTAEPMATPAPEPTPTPGPSLVTVALVRGEGVAQMVRRAVELAGGFTGLSSGATVLIKPNVNSDDPYPGTTNPEVVRAVVELVKEYGPRRTIVADRSNPAYDTLPAMKKVGIHQAAIEAGAEVMPLEGYEWVGVDPPGAENWPGGFEFSALPQEVDYMITLPVTKTHFIAGYTMALKNTVGLIHPGSRNLLHSRAGRQFGAMLAEINLARPADFVVMDGTRAFISGGPAHGQLREPNIVLATSDLVAADVVGLALLKNLGAPSLLAGNSWEEPQVARAVELGLGVSDASQVELVAEGVAEIDEIRAFI